MNKQHNPKILVPLFAFVYCFTFKQALILLSDYFVVSDFANFIAIWQSYAAFFIINLLAAQVTSKYFGKKQPQLFMFSLLVAAILFPLIVSVSFDQVWLVLVQNFVVGAVALTCQQLLEKLQTKQSGEER